LSQGGTPRRGAKFRRLPRGRSALPPGGAAAEQRERIIAATPGVVAKHGYNATTVAHIVGAAGVGRAAFYRQFSDKHDCFAAVHEQAQERLLGVLTFPCYTNDSLHERVRASLLAALEFLAADPDLAILIAVEAPAAGQELARRHLEWMKQFGALLRLGALGVPDVEKPPATVELMIAGGIVAAVAQKALAGEADRLPELAPEFTEYALTFYDKSE
jgi:AcrR family transcriptional regulator